MRFDYIGVNALDSGDRPGQHREVELRIAARCMTLKEAQKGPVFRLQLPCNGPPARVGRPIDQGGVEEIVTFYSTRLPHSEIQYQLQMIVS